MRKIKWNKFNKEEYIENVKYLYQHPDATLMIDFDEYGVDYDKTDWKKLFSKYTIEDWITTEEERKFYDNLTDKIQVYRTATEENKDGISYTTNIHVAEYFLTNSMYYQNKNAQIYTKIINKTDIQAVLTEMDEDEIIIPNPRHSNN